MNTMIISAWPGLALAGVLVTVPVPNSMTYGGVTIPGPQAQPPAGHPDIAFRPACTQVGAVYQANGLVAHTIPLPDNTIRTLIEMPPMTQGDAVRELDTAGLCKVGGIDVPIVLTDQLPQQSIGQVAASVSDAPPMATVATDGDGFAWGTVALLGGALVVGLGVGGWLWLGKASYRGRVLYQRPGFEDREPIITPPPADTEPSTEAPAEAPSTAAAGADLVDQLWG
jgi:hypothetical protein